MLNKTLASFRADFVGVEERFKRDVREVTRELAKKLMGLQVKDRLFCLSQYPNGNVEVPFVLNSR